MQNGWKAYIKNLLIKLDKLEPIPSGIDPEYHKDKSIKACLFDVYGTLLISESGDITRFLENTDNLKIAFNAAGITLNNSFKNETAILSLIMKVFKKLILQEHEESKKNNIPYPEVEIREIWHSLLHFAGKNNYINTVNKLDVMFLTLTFELLCNKVYPMPGMEKIIHILKNRDIPLGIVSNAQFYTPVIMNFFLTGQLNNEEKVVNFNTDLSFFSYKFKRAKPDTFLFEQVIPVLKNKYGIKPEEVLFVGNDLYNDIWPASLLGLKTVLFAGDKRSLRLRKNKEEINGVKPDFVITDLMQLTEIIG